jgi:RNA polymerase sigma factor (sigma-70 family)
MKNSQCIQPFFTKMHSVIADAVAKAYCRLPNNIHFNIETSMAFDICVNHVLEKSIQLKNSSSNPDGWIYKVSFNKCRDIQKSKKRTDYINENQLEHLVEATTEFDNEFDEKLDAIQDAIQNLNAMSKKVITLRFKEDCNYESISKQTGLSISSIGQTIYRGKSSIKAHVIAAEKCAA